MNNSLYASNEYSTALAVVGMAGRFPGASSLDGFWQNIANKVSSIRQYSVEEMLAAPKPGSVRFMRHAVQPQTRLRRMEVEISCVVTGIIHDDKHHPSDKSANT